MEKILYFVRGGVASPAQKEEAAKLGAKIRAANVGANDFIERCDAVAGDVPEPYRKKYPIVGGGQRGSIESGTAVVSSQGKPLADMNLRELETEAEKMGIRFPTAVNTKAERVAYIEALLAEQGAPKTSS